MDISASLSPLSSSVAIPSTNSNGNVSHSSSSSREGALSPSEASAASSPVPVEDDPSISFAAKLAREAALLFQSGKFVECVNVLNQLLQKKGDDPKILHNIAIAESFQDGCSDPKKLLGVLNEIKRRSEELACATEELTEAVSNAGSKNSVGSKGSSSVAHRFSATSSSPIMYIDEFDASVMMFNIAVIWFHLHEYGKSFSILDALYQNIEPVDEGTALRICLLLLDVALLSNRASRSADVLTYMEKVFCVNNFTCQFDNRSLIQHQTNLVSKSASLPSNSTVPDASTPGSAPTVNALESSLPITFSEEGLEDSLEMPTLPDIGGENILRPYNLQSSEDISRIQVEDSLSAIDLRLKLHLYKVRFLLLTRNLKAAKREVKMAMNTARGKDYTMVLYLKSQLEYARGNHRKAIKLLMASSNRTEMGISSIFYNDLGCIYYRLGKYYTSTVLFSRALGNSSSLRKEKPLKLASLSQDKSLQILYNCGLLYLACGKPLPAAHCFHKVSVMFYDRPILWLRIAECCLMAAEKGILKSAYYPVSDGSDVKVHVIGKGKWRQLTVDGGVSGNAYLDFEREDFSLNNDRLPNLSIPLARQCLLNACHLVEISDSKNSRPGLVSNSVFEGNQSGEMTPSKGANYKIVAGGDSKSSGVIVGPGQANANGEVKEQKSGNGQHTSLQNSICDYEDICRKENQMIKETLLADLAYVELQLGNPLKALSSARSLLRLPNCSRIYIFLGNVYAAEALCLLNRPKEAAEHLYMYVAGDSNVELPYIQDDFQKWSVEKFVDFEESNGAALPVNAALPDESQGLVFLKPEEARGTLYANLAALSAMQGDLEQSQQFVMLALSILPLSPEVILTSIYLDLLQGKTLDALSKLKQYDRIRFIPGSLTLNAS